MLYNEALGQDQWMGTFFVGDLIHFKVVPWKYQDGNIYAPRLEARPDSNPTITIYNPTGGVVVDEAEMARLGGYLWYSYQWQATGQYAANYIAHIRWHVDGVLYGESRAWYVRLNSGSGTDGQGQIISIYSYERPEVLHLVWETKDGKLIAEQNPQ